MKKFLLSTTAMLLCLTASAQSALDTDLETGAMPDGWTVKVPASPYKGGYSVVDYASQSALKVANVGTNDKGGTYVLKSVTGGINNTKGNSDNWLVSPEVTIGTANVFTFRMAANVSYSGYFESDLQKTKLDIAVINGSDTTVISSIQPQPANNYFTWKQYAFDLSAYTGKTVKIAFHDYGPADATIAKSVSDMKFFDNILLTADTPSDYSIEALTTIYGQAQYNTPYKVRVTNYGIDNRVVNVIYSYGDVQMVETQETSIASGQSFDMEIYDGITLNPGDTVTLKMSVYGPNDAIEANDSLADQVITACPIQELPYSVCNVLDNEDTEDDDLVENEFTKLSSMTTATKKVYWWPYDEIKYNAWIFQQSDSTEKYRGIAYLYSNRAFNLPAGKVYLTTTGTATGPDMHYEVYIAKYWDKNLTANPVLVGTSPIMQDVIDLGGGATETTTELTIPEAGVYTFAIRPLTTKLAQMTVIGYALSTTAPSGIKEVNADEATDTRSYNLAGQRVDASAKGIIIRGGKKYITK